jgi:hypothetical protein
VVAEEEEGVPPTTTVVAAAGLPGWYRVDDTAFRRLNPQYRERAGATPLQAALQRLQLAKLVHGRLGVGVLVLNLPAQVGPDMLGAVGRLVLGLCPDPLFRWVANGESPSCMAPGCGRAFGMLTWRHHCRRCGLLACARCVGQTGWLVTWLSEEPPHAMQDSRTNGDYYHGRTLPVCAACAPHAPPKFCSHGSQCPKRKKPMPSNGKARGALPPGPLPSFCALRPPPPPLRCSVSTHWI